LSAKGFCADDGYEYDYIAPEVLQELYEYEKNLILTSSHPSQGTLYNINEFLFRSPLDIITDTSSNDSISPPLPQAPLSHALPNAENLAEQKKQLTLEQLCDAAEISQTRTFALNLD
jgi:hypothetical protein